MQIAQHYPALLADVGGTNARFTLEVAPRKFAAIIVLKCADYPTLSDAIRAYLRHPLALEAGAADVKKAGIAIANPVYSDIVKMTNHDWSFSIQSVQNEFGFQPLLVVNDFKALAMALPYLDDTQKYQVGEGKAEQHAAIGLLGAGTGLGVSGLVPTGATGWVALDSEGGHTSFSPNSQTEIDILRFAAQKYSHVSSERLMSGAGIQLIYQALASQRNVEIEDLDTPEITRRGLSGECPLCVETLSTFCEMLGSMASNLAVLFGAKGGIYIGGGIVPRLGQFFSDSNFRKRFVQKGRFADYLSHIPTYVITEPYPAFIGISALLHQD
jgi:glucokinase